MQASGASRLRTIFLSAIRLEGFEKPSYYKRKESCVLQAHTHIFYIFILFLFLYVVERWSTDFGSSTTDSIETDLLNTDLHDLNEVVIWIENMKMYAIVWAVWAIVAKSVVCHCASLC